MKNQETTKTEKPFRTRKLCGGNVIITAHRKGESDEDVMKRILGKDYGKNFKILPLRLRGRRSPEEQRLIKEDGEWRWREAYGLMSAREIAEHSGITLRRVNRAIKDGLIKTRKIGPPDNPLVVVNVASAKRWAKKLTAATAS